MGLIARDVEISGIATTMTSWNAGIIQRIMPPHVVIIELPRGSSMGHPHHHSEQQNVLNATLALLSEEAPVPLVYLEEK